MATQVLAKKVANEALPQMETLGSILANRVFAEAPLRFRYQISPVPLEHLSSRFGIAIGSGHNEDWLAPLRDLGLEGLATKSVAAENLRSDTDWFTSDYQVDILSRGFRARFTFAHELAHVVLSREFGDLEKSLSADQRERVCDSAAAIMLCPEEALVEHFRSRSSLTVSEIESLAARMQISISLLLNRLRHLISRNAVSIDNIVLLASLSRSRKRQKNLAPRVASACSPSRWFVPLNSRLSTLGLTSLQDAFYNAPLYFYGRTNGILRLWDYDVGRRTMLPCDVRFKCYGWIHRGRTRGSSNANRIMLAVASRQEDS